jgi:FkbM family methyltransferase
VSEWLGLLRSFLVYWRPGRQRGLRRLYAPFVGAGDLVFDVGAHLGDRSVAFAALGARVIALEPQPLVARWLRRIARRRERIEVRPEAIGGRRGTERLAISSRTPTVSTMSMAWRDSARETNPGFRSVRWERTIEVPVVTLDDLIAEYGVPSFCKIDVEGWEAEALSGLTRPLPALSFEFVAGQLEVAAACVRRLRELGAYEFNVVLGEQRDLAPDAWRRAEAMLQWLDAGAAGASSGDVYARLVDDHGFARRSSRG